MRVMTTRSRSRCGVPAALVAVTLMLAACGSEDGTSDDSGGAAGSGAAAVLGEVNEASGEPVKIGFETTGATQTVDLTAEADAAQAVVDYANERLGGLAGRPIELVVCEDKNTPADAQACGNKFVGEKVVAVAAGTTGPIDASFTIVNAAGIPAGLNLGSSEFARTTPGVFGWANPVSTFGVPAAYAHEEGIDSAAIIVVDVPAAAGPAKALAPAFFENAGSSATVTAIPHGTPDMTPQIQSAENADPGMYYMVGDPTFCASVLKAIRTLGIDKPVMGLDRCISPEAGTSIPGGYEGMQVVTQSVLDQDDEEFQLFRAVLDKYGDELEPSPVTISGYQSMLSLVRAINAGEPEELTSVGIMAAIRDMPATPYPLGGGATFQCNGEALPALGPNICSTAGFIAEASTKGELSDFRALDTEGIYELG